MNRTPLKLALLTALAALSDSASAQIPPPVRTDLAGDPLPRGALVRIGTVRFRHGGPVERLAMSPDGKHLASAGRSGPVRIWEAATGKELRTLAEHKGEVRCLAFSADSRGLLTGGSDGAVRLWEVDSGKERKALLTATEWINAVAASRDGKFVAAGVDDGSVHVWDAGTLRIVREFRPEGGVARLAFSADDKSLVIGSADESSVSVWTADSGSRQRGIGGWGQALAVAPDSAMLAAANDENDLALFDNRTGKQLRRLDTIEPSKSPGQLRIHALAFLHKRQLLVAGLSDGRVVAWDTQSGQKRDAIGADAGAVFSLAGGADGRRLAWAGNDGVIRVIHDPDRKPEQPSATPGAAIVGASISPDGKTVATVSRDGSLRVFETDSAKLLGSSRADSGAFESVVLGASTLATGTRDGFVELRNARTGERLHVLSRHSAPVRHLAFIPKSPRLLTVAGQWITIADVKDRTKVSEMVGRSMRWNALSVSPDGGRLLLCDGAAEFQHLGLGKEPTISAFSGHSGGTLAVAYSPTGRLAVSGGRDSLLRIWELESGKQRKAFGGQAGWPFCVAWSPDGATIASGHADGTVRLWDGITAKRLQELLGHRGPVRSLSFSIDGKRLVTAGDDTTALVWDIPSLVQSGKLTVEPLSGDRLKACWHDLASDDAGVADQAMQALARAPAQTLPLLRAELKPVSQAQLDQWVRDLDSPKFAVRDVANKRLAAMGRSIAPLLNEVIARKPPLEVRRRVLDLIEQFTKEGAPPEELRVMRGLEVLEMIGSDEVRAVLRILADGAPSCGLTTEAKATLERMTLETRP